MTEKLLNILGMLALAALVLGWIDWLWLFGFENSKSFTWWAVMAHFAK
tara:strand:+ start:1791 stop:1934 length:144 start_codon:yes stop_codon:yes gene_type:complete